MYNKLLLLNNLLELLFKNKFKLCPYQITKLASRRSYIFSEIQLTLVFIKF